MQFVHEKIRDLEALYVRHLQMLLSAEELVAIKTPFLAEHTTDIELRQLFQNYALTSREQVGQIRALLERASSDSDPLKCKVVYALFEEAEDLVRDALHDDVRNAVVIAVAERIKHYEIAFYSATAQFAHVLGRDADARNLDQITAEERAEDQQLCNIAERINPSAKKAA
jgi:ferritin-like metal-binding protein YciE